MITLKNILQEVQERNFETSAVTYASNPAPKYRRLVKFANQAVRKIINAHDWSFLKKTATITIVDGTTLYDKPADYYRLIEDTAYRGNSYFPVEFPASDQSIEYRKQHNVGQIYQGRFYQGGIEFVNLPEGDITFEYVSDRMVQKYIDESYGLKFTNDNDVFVPDSELLDELIILGTTALYLTAKRDESAGQAVAEYMYELNQQKYNDVGARTINDLQQPSQKRTLWRHNPNYES